MRWRSATSKSPIAAAITTAANAAFGRFRRSAGANSPGTPGASALRRLAIQAHY
jgi:hypothetical protein